MIFVGIDDTDTLDSRGTNQLAKAMARAVSGDYPCRRIVRHQLLDDPRVPYTSKNGTASLVFESAGGDDNRLTAILRQIMQEDFIPGSDPGLCVATTVADEIVAFARCCQQELVSQQHARELAAAHGVFLEGLGGSNDGVIGALAAVGLAAADNDGRVVQWQRWPDDLSGLQSLETLNQRDIDVRHLNSGETIGSGQVDVGKHLRPNWRAGRCVVFVVPHDQQPASFPCWQAVRLP